MTDANSSEPSWLQPSPVTLNSDDDDPTAPPKSKEDKKAQLDANSFKPSWATEEEDQGDERKGLLKGNQENYQTDPNNKKKKKKKRRKKREANLNDSDYETSDSDFDVEKGEPRRDPFLPPLRTPLHKFFITLQIVTILSSFSLLASTLTTLYFSVNLLNLTQMTVRMYSIIFTVFIVIGELELFNIFIQNWIARGFIYVYIGVSSEDFLSDGVLDQVRECGRF
ncbi:hypothetical protein TL16_g13114 [Triparma laevis f. inornata]|uniref:Uncharacterized protein n=2 Tax=Triparma laevis TaxID=1534972 RepID=A0A9W7AZ57_9STRA|nr:hypothetical protein TrLO_g9483 [Triparma laevis f. longispina]GMH95264.1 hypothetical protein TL16_g13114 [Triparma laevis f. inornata]